MRSVRGANLGCSTHALGLLRLDTVSPMDGGKIKEIVGDESIVKDFI